MDPSRAESHVVSRTGAQAEDWTKKFDCSMQGESQIGADLPDQAEPSHSPTTLLQDLGAKDDFVALDPKSNRSAA
jgi:hypothetical protein